MQERRVEEYPTVMKISGVIEKLSLWMDDVARGGAKRRIVVQTASGAAASAPVGLRTWLSMNGCLRRRRFRS